VLVVLCTHCCTYPRCPPAEDPVHLATGRRFNGWVFTAPLAAGRDELSKLPFPHANFHLPEIVGNARAFEVIAVVEYNRQQPTTTYDITNNNLIYNNLHHQQ
jgi:hypothetical protein